MTLTWLYHDLNLTMNHVIPVTRIIGKCGQDSGMPRKQNFPKMIKMDHTSPSKDEIIISWKFLPNLIIFDKVIVTTKILGKFGQDSGMPRRQNLSEWSKWTIVHLVTMKWSFLESFSQIQSFLTELLPRNLIFKHFRQIIVDFSKNGIYQEKTGFPTF